MAYTRQEITDLFSMFHDFKIVGLHLFCDSDSTGLGAQLKFTAGNIRIVDQHNNAITVDKLKEVAKQWWDSIQKTWDDQKQP